VVDGASSAAVRATAVSTPSILGSVVVEQINGRSPDGGKTWLQVGTIGAGPRELTVSPKGELYASVSGSEIRRSTDGGATWSKVVTLG